MPWKHFILLIKDGLFPCCTSQRVIISAHLITFAHNFFLQFMMGSEKMHPHTLWSQIYLCILLIFLRVLCKILFILAASYHSNYNTPTSSHLRMGRFNERDRDGSVTAEGQRALVGGWGNHQRMGICFQRNPPYMKDHIRRLSHQSFLRKTLLLNGIGGF